MLIVVSTYGEGDPPQPATGFFEFIEGRKAPKLDGKRFAVLALGDSTYEFYCEAGKRLDRRFEKLGAERRAARRLRYRLRGSRRRSEEHTSELQSLMRISYAVFCLNTKKRTTLSDLVS